MAFNIDTTDPRTIAALAQQQQYNSTPSAVLQRFEGFQNARADRDLSNRGKETDILATQARAAASNSAVRSNDSAVRANDANTALRGEQTAKARMDRMAAKDKLKLQTTYKNIRDTLLPLTQKAEMLRAQYEKEFGTSKEGMAQTAKKVNEAIGAQWDAAVSKLTAADPAVQEIIPLITKDGAIDHSYFRTGALVSRINEHRSFMLPEKEQVGLAAAKSSLKTAELARRYSEEKLANMPEDRRMAVEQFDLELKQIKAQMKTAESKEERSLLAEKKALTLFDAKMTEIKEKKILNLDRPLREEIEYLNNSADDIIKSMQVVKLSISDSLAAPAEDADLSGYKNQLNDLNAQLKANRRKHKAVSKERKYLLREGKLPPLEDPAKAKGRVATSVAPTAQQAGGQTGGLTSALSAKIVANLGGATGPAGAAQAMTVLDRMSGAKIAPESLSAPALDMLVSALESQLSPQSDPRAAALVNGLKRIAAAKRNQR